MTIMQNQTLQTEVVLSERVTTNEFRITEIHENVQNRFVRAEIELGPFVTEQRPNGETEIRGTGRQGVTVWQNDEYDEVRDTWRNEDLIAKVLEVLSSNG